MIEYEIYISGMQKKYLQEIGNTEKQLIDPVVTKVVNAADTFEFTITRSHPHFDDCVPSAFNIIVSRKYDFRGTQTSEVFFDGRIVETSEDMYGQKRVRCTGLYDLLKNAIIYPGKWIGSMNEMIQAALSAYNGQARIEDQLGLLNYLSDKTLTVPVEMEYTSVYDAFKKFTDQVGGYFCQRSAALEYYAYGNTKEEATHDASLGINLIERTVENDSTAMVTRVFPLGAKTGTQTGGVDTRLTIFSVAGRDYIDRPQGTINQYGVKAKTVIFDEITDASELMAAGQAYLSQNGTLSVTENVSAIDMSYLEPGNNKPWNLCDIVRIIVPEQAMSALVVTKITVNINAPQNDRVTIGKTTIVPITQQIKS